MNEIKYITNSFRGATEHNERHMDMVGPAIAEAGERISAGLLDEAKVICAGDGQSAMLADYLCQMLMSRFEQPRPGLPAISLNSSGNTLLALACDEGFTEALSIQLRALAQQGDVLVVFFHEGLNAQLSKACKIARKRGAAVVGIGQDADTGDDLAQLLDVWVELDALSRARCVELQVVCLHALCEMIEQRIFGFTD